MPAKFSSMSSSGTVENLSLQLFQALNGTERLAVQACKLLSVTAPTKKERWSHKGPLLFLNRLFIFYRLFGPFGLLSSCCNCDALAIAKSAADRLKLDDPVG